MNQGKIWCVVNPTVGLPLLLGGVMTVSLIVHASVMSHTTWVAAFFQGGSKATVAQTGPAPANVTPASNTPAYAISVTPVSTVGGQGATSFVVTVTPSGGASASTTMVADAGTRSPGSALRDVAPR